MTAVCQVAVTDTEVTVENRPQQAQGSRKRQERNETRATSEVLGDDVAGRK